MTDLEISKLYIKSLAEKYGNEAVYDAINERSYNYNYYNRDMDSPGTTSSYNGAKGFMKSIPSFLLCALISPPLAGIMLLGALFHRVNQKWHDHDSAIAMMNPFTWAEYLATGNYVPKGMDKPFWTAGENAQEKNVEKIGGDSSAMASALINAQLNENVPEDEAGSLIYNYHWLFFDNGEIRKTKCYTEEDAKRAALTYLKKQNRNDKQNEGARLNYEGWNTLLKKDKEYSIYICEYDDGQLMYSIGKTESEAKKQADSKIIGIAQYFKKIDPTYEVPEIKYVTETNWDYIKPMTKYEGCSRVKPMHKDILPSHRNTNGQYYWEFDNFKQYTAKLIGGLGGLITFKIPAVFSDNDTQANEIVNILFENRGSVWNNYMALINDSKKMDQVWYEVKTKDGDKYIIPEDKGKSTDNIYDIAMQLSEYKITVIKSIMSSTDFAKVNNKKIDFDNRNNFKIVPLKYAEDDTKRSVKEINFNKQTKVSLSRDDKKTRSSERRTYTGKVFLEKN